MSAGYAPTPPSREDLTEEKTDPATAHYISKIIDSGDNAEGVISGTLVDDTILERIVEAKDCPITNVRHFTPLIFRIVSKFLVQI